MVARRLIPFFLVLSAGSVLMVLAGPRSPKSTATANAFWAEKTHGEGAVDVVVIGDSRIYRGFATPVAADRLRGLSVLNFGYSSLGVDSLVLRVAQERLKTDGARTIVVGVTPHLFTREAMKNGHFLEEWRRPRNEVFIRRHFEPVLRLVDPLTIPDVIAWVRRDTLGYHQTFHAGGWVASRQVPEDSTSALAYYEHEFRTGGGVRKEGVALLAGHIAKWAQEGIRVFLVRPPVTAAMLALEDSLSGHDRRVEEALAAAGGQWIRLPLTGYHSFDGSHLREDAARQWTGQLCDSLLVHGIGRP